MLTRALGFALLALALPAEGRQPRYYQARLLDPVSSEFPAGSRFVARIVGPLSRRHEGQLPRNTEIHGAIRRSAAVGLGFRRERAFLELEFNGCVLPSGAEVDCSVELVEVDNARESVPRANFVQGIAAASHPHSWVNGMWLRPTPVLFGKSVLGLTGAGGVLHSRMMPNPIAAAAIVGLRAILFRLPEPDIHLPPGADLILRVSHAGNVPEGPAIEAQPTLRPEVPEALAGSPAEVFQGDGARAADIINLVFSGSKEEVENAFHAAGWTAAEPLNARTFGRVYGAAASMSAYASAPVSPLYYRGRLPDVVFQRSLNSLAKRHHIRLWKTAVEGETFWLGAATQDVALAFDWSRLSLTHKIDRHIDRERNIILNDLEDAGCISTFEVASRAALESPRSPSGVRVTDGGLAVVWLRGCRSPEASARLKCRHRILHAVTRRVVLETRHYITRGNPYYYAYLAVRRRAAKRVSLLQPE